MKLNSTYQECDFRMPHTLHSSSWRVLLWRVFGPMTLWFNCECNKLIVSKVFKKETCVNLLEIIRKGNQCKLLRKKINVNKSGRVQYLLQNPIAISGYVTGINANIITGILMNTCWEFWGTVWNNHFLILVLNIKTHKVNSV